MSTGSSASQGNNRVRLTGAQFQPMLKRLTERLYDTVNRGPILRCFATKGSRSRLDVVRLNGAVRDEDDVAQDFASYLVQKLVRSENAKVSFELDISARDAERRQRSLALYYALTQGIVRGADAIFRESGLRSLWLAYPFLLARDITDPENKRSILAPIYFWPIQIQASLEKQGELIIRRDPQAGGAVFNRVLARWTRMNLAVDLPTVELDMNEDGQIEIEEIEAAVRTTLKGLAEVEVPNMLDGISPVPARQEVDSLHQPSVLNCGILGLFVSENQALIENLERMQRLGEIHDPLESILANRQADSESVKLPVERDRYLVTASDPYQELAVWESRKAPGSVVHGPPGTGKSQTIVNIVADCLARKERVLVVCQKRAAIDVVAERLRAVGLDDLCVVVHDSETDRRQIFSDLKDQINSLREHATSDSASERGRLSEEIDRRESELEEYHRALQSPRPTIGLSYRQLVGRSTVLYDKIPSVVSSRDIEEVFYRKSIKELERAEANLQELAHVWALAAPKTNPWVQRAADFVLTRPLQEEISSLVRNCIDASARVDNFVAGMGTGIGFGGDPSDFISTAQEWRDWTSSFMDSCRLSPGAYWINKSASKEESILIFEKEMSDLSSLASRLQDTVIDTRVEGAIRNLNLNQLSKLSQSISVLKLRYQGGWWRVLTPSYHAALKHWKSLGLGIQHRSGNQALEAVEAQCSRRECRLRIVAGLESLGIHTAPALSDSALQGKVASNLTGIHDAAKLISASKSNAVIQSLLDAAKSEDKAALNEFVHAIDVAIQRAHLLEQLRDCLNFLQRWLRSDYLTNLLSISQQGKSIRQALQNLIEYLPKVTHLCAFDAMRSRSPEPVVKLLHVLAESTEEGGVGIWNRWETVLRYSAYSAWINLCLKETPILQSLSPELYERSRKALASAITEKRSIEVRAIKDSWLAAQSALHSLRPSPLIGLRSQLVTRGRNSKRLRQAVSIGTEMGIFTLRPCWMMNPNTACQIFQLTPGLFDVVVFDEASQCPLEQGTPILHRGKRTVVAGDEKQLPPTSFFLSVTPFDDEESELAESEPTEEQIQRELRRDVLASKDLLSVCEPVLRNSYLDMHYRSEDPLLIQFSNKAFYGGRLQCPPCFHSNGDLPIVVSAVNGIYDRQTNHAEAQAIVQLLRKLWLEETFPGTIGVVTFNLKQEDLVQNLLQAEALRDPAFRTKYESECDRKDGRQDVSFFVKNLEAVQGDERDAMIFSTTFGLDAQGQFRRFFGPLNMDGGERRLNVAVTRAKKKIFVVTSLPVSQISDLFAASGSRGAVRVSGRDYLQAYMRYAEAVSSKDAQTRAAIEQQLGELARISGFETPEASQNLDFDSEFEMAVFDALTRQGLKVEQQIGDAGFRIDLAIRHPIRENSYILGIECDGRTYHSQFTARARDIWRQQILESRGWNIHRIWSTSWCGDPDGEISKIMSRIEALSGS